MEKDTVLSYDLSDAVIRDFARIMQTELIYINDSTTQVSLERELMLGDILYGR